MHPLVSIIIPVYNNEKHLSAAIQSVIAQSWSNKEIILVDDGSQDNSLELAKSFENEWIKVFHQENKGASAARNLALKYAKGDYIQFLDADDLLAPDKIENQINCLKGFPNSLAYSDTVTFKNDDDFIVSESYVLSEELKNTTDPYQFLLHLYGGYGVPAMVTVHAWLTPSTVIKKAGDWNENLSMDDDGEFFCRVLLAADSVKFCADTLSYYRKYDDNSNLSAQRSITSFESEFLSIKLKTENLLATKDTKEARTAMAFWFIRLAILSYPRFSEFTKRILYEIKKLGVKPQIPIMGGKFTEFLKKYFGWKFVRNFQYSILKYR